ncbi:hypothetical protein TNCV_2085871 [Trichonephila clavipes]|nr:hypothetical protein TNCV_2085871 [Trichonephila clavipes]
MSREKSRRTLRTLQVRKAISPKCVLVPPVMSWCTRKAGNDILPQPLGGRCSSLFFRRGTTLLSGRVLEHAER